MGSREVMRWERDGIGLDCIVDVRIWVTCSEMGSLYSCNVVFCH